MKLRTSLLAIPLFLSMLLLTEVASAQNQHQYHEFSPEVQARSTAVAQIRVLRTTSVQLDGETYTIVEADVTSHSAGSTSSRILIDIPGGTTPTGGQVIVSHQPYFEAGDTASVALVASISQGFSGLAGNAGLPVYSIVGGLEGVRALPGMVASQAEASGNFTLTGSSFGDFPVDFYVNPSNSGVSSSGTIAAVKRGFDLWEDDIGSDMDFRYKGTTGRRGNLGDSVNTVYWTTTPNPAHGYLAQASWTAHQNGDIIGFDIKFNLDYQWANGAANGRWDIGTTVGHEAGHALGLGHSTRSSDVMYHLINAGRTKPLGPGDLAGAAHLYPAQNIRIDPPVSEQPSSCPDAMVLGSLRSGVAAYDNATGYGYLMWSAQGVQGRFSPTPTGSNAAHVVAVKLQGDQWYRDTNSGYEPFTPRHNDCLVAGVDFDANVVLSYEGRSGSINGAAAGYRAGDMLIKPNRYNGSYNAGEFDIPKGEMLQNVREIVPPVSSSPSSCPDTMVLGSLRSGVAAYDNATGYGYLMWSAQGVQGRFSPTPTGSNAAHLMVVKLIAGQWHFDTNRGYQAFTPRHNDCLIAGLDFDQDEATSFVGRAGSISGMAAGYQSGALSISPNQYNGSSNAGEFEVNGSILNNS